MDDPSPLRCVGNNHVPGCEHFPEVPLHAIVDDEETALMVALMSQGKVRASVHSIPMAVEIPAGLDFDIHVTLTKAGRRRCPRCHLRRQLFRLTAFSADQPVGYGRSRCLECAGLRSVR